jgi:hypothetical protein
MAPDKNKVGEVGDCARRRVAVGWFLGIGGGSSGEADASNGAKRAPARTSRV